MEGTLFTKNGVGSKTFWLPAQVTPFTPVYSTSLVPFCPGLEGDDPGSCWAIYSMIEYDVVVYEIVNDNWPVGYAEFTSGTGSKIPFSHPGAYVD